MNKKRTMLDLKIVIALSIFISLIMLLATFAIAAEQQKTNTYPEPVQFIPTSYETYPNTTTTALPTSTTTTTIYISTTSSTTTSSSTTTEAPTTTIKHIPHKLADVERWFPLAVEVGWKVEDWSTLSCVMFKESRGQPDVKNKNGSATGLLQILARYHKEDLYDPKTNLEVGLDLYKHYGWEPWSTTVPGCK